MLKELDQATSVSNQKIRGSWLPPHCQIVSLKSPSSRGMPKKKGGGPGELMRQQTRKTKHTGPTKGMHSVKIRKKGERRKAMQISRRKTSFKKLKQDANDLSMHSNWAKIGKKDHTLHYRQLLLAYFLPSTKCSIFRAGQATPIKLYVMNIIHDNGIKQITKNIAELKATSR